MLQRRPHKDALPSEFGWFLPKTGELLVSIRGLEKPVQGYVPNRPYQTITKQEVPETLTEHLIPEVEPLEVIDVTTQPIINADKDAALNFLADNNIITMPTTDIAIDAVKTTTKTKSKK